MTPLAPKQYGLTFNVGDVPASGPLSVQIGFTIDQARMLRLNQTTASVQITIPAPTDASITYGIDVVNEGTAQTEVEGVTLQAGQGARFAWNGTAWFQVGGPSSAGVWAPIAQYNPANDTFSSQLYTSYTSLPVASPANAGQVFEISSDRNTSNWASPNAPTGLASFGDWIYSNGTTWILWRNQNRRIGQGDQLAAATAPVERNTTHPLDTNDLWFNTTSNELYSRDSTNTAWQVINDPVSVVFGTASPIVTTKSQSFVASDNVGLIPFTLNATPAAGEHVRVYWNPSIIGTGSFSINGKTYTKESNLAYVDVVFSGSAPTWHTYESFRSQSQGLIKGFFYPDQDRIDDISTLVTIGTLPAPAASNVGHIYITKNSVTAANWATANMAATDIASGDLVYSDGTSWYHQRMTDLIVGAGDIQMSTNAPTTRKYKGFNSLTTGDLWISSGAEKNRLSHYVFGTGWEDTGANDMSQAAIITASATVTSQYNQSYLVRSVAGNSVTVGDGLYDGQILRFVRDASWAAGEPTFAGISAGKIVYPTDADKPTKNNVAQIVMIWDATASVWRATRLASAGGGITVASTAPATATLDAGHLWWDDANLELYVLHSDGVTKAWVSTSGTGGPLTSVSQSAIGAVVNCSLGNVYEFTVIGAMTLSFTNPPAVGNAYIATCRVVVNAGGALSYPASVRWPSGVAPSLTANSSKVHILTFMTFDGGSSWFGNALTDY